MPTILHRDEDRMTYQEPDPVTSNLEPCARMRQNRTMNSTPK
jgi:hypothetical protein